MIALLVLGVIDIEANKPFALLGTDTSIELIVRADAQPIMSANVGEVSVPRKTDASHYAVTFTLPAKKFPQLAIIAARDGASYRFFSLPLHAPETLSLETKPRADVEVSIAAKTFGPVKADAKGRVKVPVTVPPGVPSGTVRSVDMAGNAKEVTVALAPPPFSRAHIIALGDGASWHDQAALPIVAFVVGSDARPVQTAPTATATQGTLGPCKLVSPGVVTTAYRAPDTFSIDHALVRIEDASGRLAVLAGPPSRIDVTFSPPSVVAGVGGAVTIDARSYDSKGNRVAGVQPALSADLGTIVGNRLDVPANTRGLAAVSLVAALPSLKHEAKLPLAGATPVRGVLTPDTALVRAGGEPLGATLRLFDRFGNNIDDAEVRVLSPAGITTAMKQGYRFALAVDKSVAPGRSTLEIEARGLRVAAPVIVLAPELPWGVSLGVTASAHMNTARTTSVTGALALAVRPVFLPIEILFDAGGRYYLSRSSGGVTARFTGAPFTLGIRYNLALTTRFALMASASGGLQPSWSTLTSAGGVRQSGFFVAPVAAAALGAAARLGPGRLFADVGWQYVGGGSGISGNLGGFGLRVGYLYEIR